MSFEGKTVAQLKEECRKRGLPVSGTKAVLIERLNEAAEENMEEEEDESSSSSSSEEVKPPSKKRKATEEPKSPAAKKAKVSIPVDQYCSVNGDVYEDWGVMLNQTNISQNNNKFYVIQLIVSGGSHYVFTRWGRVGEKGQSGCKNCGSLANAQKEWKSKFKSKTKNDWDVVHKDPSKFKSYSGSYTLLEMDHNEDDAAELEEALETLASNNNKKTPPKKIRPCTLPAPTQSLIKIIFDNDMFKQQMVKFDLDVKKMPLGKLSSNQVDKGYEVLEEIGEALASGNKRKLESLTSTFYTIIPHSFGRQRPPPIQDSETLQQKKDMLAVLGDIALAQKLAAEKVDTGKSEVVEVDHPLDVSYQSLKCDIKPLDRSAEEYKVIETYLNNTMGDWRKLKLLDVFEVRRDGETERFKIHDAIENRKLLWHGTNAAVVVAILSSGLRIMPHSGGRVGKGIYFASENSKSAGYVGTTNDNIGFMFLNEVALGKEHYISRDDSSLTKAPAGYDSIIAKGWTEPDPSKDTTITLDGKEVIVPQGKPIPQDKWNQSSFSQSEYLVYKESQNHMRYLLKLKF